MSIEFRNLWPQKYKISEQWLQSLSFQQNFRCPSILHRAIWTPPLCIEWPGGAMTPRPWQSQSWTLHEWANPPSMHALWNFKKVDHCINLCRSIPLGKVIVEINRSDLLPTLCSEFFESFFPLSLDFLYNVSSHFFFILNSISSEDLLFIGFYHFPWNFLLLLQ